MKSTLVTIVLFTLLLPSALSYSALNFVDSSCYADGSFTFVIENDKPTPVYTNEIEVSMRHAFLNLTPHASGVWTRTTIYDSINATNRSLRKTSYLSGPAILTEGGDYFVTLSYFGCRNPPTCRVSFLLNDCPEYNSQCEQSKLKATSCTLDGKSATVVFQGVLDEYETVRPEFDVFYYFEMADSSFIKLPRLTTVMSVEQLSLNKFKVVLPMDNPYDVVGVSVVKKSCDAPRHQRKSIPCQLPDSPSESAVFDDYKKYMGIAPFYEEATPEEALEEILIAPEGSDPVLEAIIPSVAQPVQNTSPSQLPLVGAAIDVVQQAMPAALPVQDAQLSNQPVVEVKVRPVREERLFTAIPVHFYILLGIVALGILLLIVSNSRRPKQPARPKRSWEAIWEDDKRG